MRITAFILSLYVCFLAIAPVAGLLPGGICCLEVCADDQDQHHDEEEGRESREVCNPFLSCQCCVVFTSVVGDHSAGAGALCYDSHNGRIRQLCSSQVILPVWHPPKG